jgi:formylmethanofuran dehydrogenase subunit E
MSERKHCSTCGEAHKQLRTKLDDKGTMRWVCLRCFYAMGACTHDN